MIRILKKIKNRIFSMIRMVNSLVKRSFFKIEKVIRTPIDVFNLKKILRENKGKHVIVYPPTVDWNIPQFQRPQHLALELSKNDFVFFYCTSNTYDKIVGIKKLEKNLFITNRFDLIKKYCTDCYLILHAAHPNFKYKEIIGFKDKGWKIIYDYVDKIDPDICGKSSFILKRHKLFKGGDLDFVLTTAKNLYLEMIKRFDVKKVILNPNGVEFKHFQISRNKKNIPRDLKKIINQKKPIIGYYGALAKWIDYRLLEKIASKKPNYNIVLIGWNYDNSLDNLKKYKNIFYLGVKEYKKLPEYAIWFDLAIIPFKRGEIAKSTSPLKLFEYFALGKSVIVTKDLVECKKYKEVFYGDNHDQFIEKIDQAFKAGKNKLYINKLKNIAQNNTWSKRAHDIKSMIVSQYSK